MNLNRFKSIPKWTQLPSSPIFCLEASPDCIDTSVIQLQQQMEYLKIQLELERQEYSRKIQQIQKFQGLLQYITEQIRDSLDDQQILTIVTQELVNLLSLNRCQIELYNLSLTAATITYEYSSSLPQFQGLTTIIADFPQIYQSLLQKKIWQSVEIIPGHYSNLQFMNQLALANSAQRSKIRRIRNIFFTANS
jgi:dGTP triphosphohydrolase